MSTHLDNPTIPSGLSNLSLPIDVDVDGLNKELEAIEAADRARQDFVKSLMHHIQRLSREREEHTKALRRTELLASTLQDRYERAIKDIGDLQRDIDCGNFILVLIDGDDTLFQDEYVADGLRGGERAARDLRQTLFDYFKGKKYFKNDDKIVMRIYLKLGCLSKTYVAAKILSDEAVFQQFVEGFNKTHDLMGIIDAGNGKEGADRKVKAEFDMFRRNVHCKQIVLGGSGDNGYGGFLSQYAQTSVKSNRITLIEAKPFAQELRHLSDKFESVRFEQIFRNTKLIIRQGSFHEDANRARTPPPPAYIPTAYAAKATVAGVAGQASNAVNSKAGNGSSEDWKVVEAPKRSLRPIYVNDFDQRVDFPIKNHSAILVGKLKYRKLCNKHYLEKYCPFGNTCTHGHGQVLTPIELENLRQVARLKACGNGLQCRDPDCIDGHRCQNGPRCAHRANKNCKFSDEMHDVEVNKFKAVNI